MKFDKSVLREADIRGVYSENITVELANRIGKVFGTYMQSVGEFDCVVGHDNRIGGRELTEDLIKGLLSTGVNVHYIGLVTTPMLNYASHKMGYQYGIMVTASHNPACDNGFKLFGKDYQHCDHDVLKIIYDAINDENYSIKSGMGTLNKCDIKDDYAEYMSKSIKMQKNMKIVVDCGNGTASTIIKDVYDRIPCEVIYICSKSDPTFPNHHPDPNVVENLKMLQEAVVREHADVGFSYDGDADRCGFVDENGNVVEADVLMAVMSKKIINENINKTILIDVKCSKTLEDEIKASNGEFLILSPSSAEQEREMFYRNLPFGGGYSNHIFFKDRHFGYDDGIYVGLRVQEYLSEENSTLSEKVSLLNKYYNTHEIKVKTTDEAKWNIVEAVKDYSDSKGYEYSTVDGVKVFKDNSWALVRASNTGPNLTLRFESTTEKDLMLIKEEFEAIIEENK